MPKRKSVDERLSELEALAAGDRPALSAALETALADRHYRVVAKGARLTAEALLYEHEPLLLDAYARLLAQPSKRDPGCFAKSAIVRALVELDCGDTEFFLGGLRYRQLEPVWGGRQDSAIDVRCGCAMGLVAAGFPRALVELTELLNDPEAPARAGAARAIACGNPREAELLLRAKVLAGDCDPTVLGECFTGLLTVEPDEGPAFVARYLGDPDESVRELAALALGESRTEAALDALRAAWDEVLPPPGLRRALVRAAAVHRSDAAFAWLLSLVAESNVGVGEEVLAALAAYKHNKTLAKRLRAVLVDRGDDALDRSFAEHWE